MVGNAALCVPFFGEVTPLYSFVFFAYSKLVRMKLEFAVYGTQGAAFPT